VSAAISSAFKAFARVAVGHFGEMAQRSFFRLDLQVTKAAFGVGQRALQKQKKLVLCQRAQFKNLRARDERRIDEEKRVVRCCADEPHDTALDIRQQNILLRPC